jgi:hypothetical protein
MPFPLKRTYHILTDDTDQILLGRPREGCDVVDHSARESRSYSPGRMVGSDEKQPVTTCVTYHIWIGF